MKKYYLLFAFLLLIFSTNAQQKPNYVIKSDPVMVIPPLSSRQNLPPPPVHKGEVNPRRSGQNTIVPGKGLPKGNDPLIQDFNRSVQHSQANTILTFMAANLGATPSDPTGAVGPNHYVVAYNTAFKIFDKNGNVLINDTNLSTLFPGHTSDGDPIVLYDRFADRFLITQFDVSSNPNKFLVAISQTGDPVNSGWYTYAFSVSGGMPDYPKYSVWSDGYYITANKDSNTASTSDVIYVLERDKMINGDSNVQMLAFPLPGIRTNGFYSPLGANVNGSILPPPGNAPIVYLQDDSWSGISQDHLKIWNINVDWNNPSNSNISSTPQQINTAAFNSVFNNGSFQNLPQPNNIDIDALQATIMFMNNYRRFPNYNSMVLNFVVNTDNQGKAGIRWYELRQNNDGDNWYINQEGTYIDPSNHHTFAGSINMDALGNIALGYTIVDTNQVPELYYTGRLASDPAGQMTITPVRIVQGVQSNPSNRYGDYSQMTIDPTDDKTFWFISEYFSLNRRVDYVAVFKLAADLNNDIGISSIDAPVDATLSNSESITVTIYNYGLQAQTNFPVSYQIDNGSIITENFSGTLAAGSSTTYTFSTTADLSQTGHTYTITASTGLSTDEDTSNDSYTSQVTNLPADDMGITDLISPVSSVNLGSSEVVTVKIKNFGGVTQTNVPVSYTVNGNTVNETAPGPFNPNSESNYTFSQTVNMSAIGNYNITASTHLPNDVDTSNDAYTTVITHNMCQPSSNCTYGDYIQNITIGTINNSSTCGTNGYEDFTYISTDLLRGQTHDMTITVGYSEEYVKAWIDFNDDFSFDSSEIIIDNYELGQNQTGAGTYSHTFSINIPANANLGEHLMRIRTNWQNPILDACSNVSYGETEDYKVNIVDASLVDSFSNAQIVLQTLADNHFLVKVENVQNNDDLILEVYTMGGKQIVYHKLKKVNNEYTYDLNLSYVAKGVYLLKVGNDKGGKIKKIIVK